MTRRRARMLITVRHSVTRHNATGIISGRLDEPLSDEGRALVHEYVETCGRLSADTVVASPMCRAIETAAILTGRAAASIVVDPTAVERDYGELQGLDREQVKRYADRIDYIEVGGIRHSLNPPGGESFEDVRARAVTFRDHVEAMPPGTIVVVAHQVFLQQLHGLLLGASTHDSLALDIQSLQIDRFDLDVGEPVCHEVLHTGIQRYKSW